MRFFRRWRQRRERCACCDHDLARIEAKLDTILARLPTAENLMRVITRSHQNKEPTE